MDKERLSVRVARITREALDINSYELVDPGGGALPPFTAGAHLDVWVPNGELRQFSLCNNPSERRRYVVAVLRERQGRGGSVSFHDDVREGDLVTVSTPRNNFPLNEYADNHLLIAGGIGVTPLMAMVRRLEDIGARYRLYYCARLAENAAFLEELRTGPFAPHVEFVFDEGRPEEKGLDVRSLLATREPGTHLYCCGPGPLMGAVAEAARASYPEEAIHFEYFSTEGLDVEHGESADFQVEIRGTGQVFDIPADKSILDVLREAGFDLDSSCEEGICGTCATQVIAGEVDHRDLFLTEKAKNEGKWMMICISRARGDRLVLELPE